MSLFDSPKPYLEQNIWSNDNTLHPHVRQYVMDLLQKIYPMERVYSLTMIGSSVGYQYSPTSDVDINVVARKGESFDAWHKIFKVFNETPNLLPGTQHPINFFFQEWQPDSDWSNSLGAYDIIRQVWVKRPIPFDKIGDPGIKYEREIAYAKTLLSMIDSEVALLDKAKQLNDIPSIERYTRSLALIFKTIEDNRKTAYRYHTGTPALQEYNILYKLIESSKHGELFHKMVNNFDIEKIAVPLRIPYMPTRGVGIYIDPSQLKNVLLHVKGSRVENPETFKQMKQMINQIRGKSVLEQVPEIGAMLKNQQTFDRAMTHGIVGVSPKAIDERNVLRHELTHYLRHKKGKSKNYGFNPFVRLREEYVANEAASRRQIPNKLVRKGYAAADSMVQEAILSPKSSALIAGTTLIGGAYGINKLRKGIKKEANFQDTKRKIKDNVNYAWYVTKHKANIVPPMMEMGLPLGQALAHDLSKYGPKEFPKYREWFVGPYGLRGTKDPKVFKQWRKAVDHHYKNNLHHWHKQGLQPSQVPLNTRMESVADWYSVGKTNRTTKKYPSFKNWYIRREAGLPIDPETRTAIDKNLGIKK